MRNRQDKNEAVREGWLEVFGTYNPDWLYQSEVDEADAFACLYPHSQSTVDSQLWEWLTREHTRAWCELELAREHVYRHAKNRARARCAVRWLARNR